MSSKQKLARFAQKWAAPLLLIVMALRQLILAQTMGLSPWKGGGFGMFASLDKSQSRLLVIQGITPTRTKIQIEPKSLTKIISPQQLRKLKSIPAPALMQQSPLLNYLLGFSLSSGSKN